MCTSLDQILGRVYLDANIIQYLCEFDTLEGDIYGPNYIINSKGNKIKNNRTLYAEILSLGEIFKGLDRTRIQLIISPRTYVEILESNNSTLISYAGEWIIHSEEVLDSYKDLEKENSSSIKAIQDNRLQNNFSNSDRAILLKAIFYECDILISADKFVCEQNQKYFYEKYNLQLLKPSQYLSIMQPYQALWY